MDIQYPCPPLRISTLCPLTAQRRGCCTLEAKRWPCPQDIAHSSPASCSWRRVRHNASAQERARHAALPAWAAGRAQAPQTGDKKGARAMACKRADHRQRVTWPELHSRAESAAALLEERVHVLHKMAPANGSRAHSWLVARPIGSTTQLHCDATRRLPLSGGGACSLLGTSGSRRNEAPLARPATAMRARQR
jgi:hypothetical protein